MGVIRTCENVFIFTMSLYHMCVQLYSIEENIFQRLTDTCNALLCILTDPVAAGPLGRLSHPSLKIAGLPPAPKKGTM